MIIESMVQLLLQGAAGSLGTELTQSTVALVRDKLGTNDQGRAALDALGRDANAAVTIADLRLAVASAVRADPSFEARVAAALRGEQQSEFNSQRPSGDIHVSGSTLGNRSTLVTGNVTNIHGTQTAAIAAIIIAILTGIAVYIYNQSKDGDSRPQRPETTTAISKPLTMPQLRTTIPDLNSMPTGWHASAPTQVGTRAEFCENQQSFMCAGLVGVASAAFKSPDGSTVNFNAFTTTSVDTARANADELWRDYITGGGSVVDIPNFGDEAKAATYQERTLVSIVRVGTTVLSTDITEPGHYGDDDEINDLQGFTASFVDRCKHYLS